MKRFAVLSTAVFTFTLLFFACSTNNDFESALDAVLTADSESYDNAYSRLTNLSTRGLTHYQAAALVRALNHTFPKRKYEFQDTQTDLIRCLESYTDPDLVAMLDEQSSKLSPAGLGAMIQQLTRIDSPAAIASVLRLLDPKTEKKPDFLSLGNWQKTTIQAKAIFPRLLDFGETENYRSEVLLTLLEYLKNNKIERSTLEVVTQKALALFKTLKAKEKNLSIDRTKANWVYNEDYLVFREELAICLDAFGYLPSAVVRNELGGYLESADKRLAFFSFTSLNRLGEAIKPGVMAEIAANPEMRKWLFRYLKENHIATEMPAKFASQEKLAESDMVNWLIYPTELGQAPDEIELGKTVTIDTGPKNGKIAYYVFKFRTFEPHWAAKNGWMAGVSGPFIANDMPTADSLGETFSTFDAWGSKSPDEFVGDVQEIIKRWNGKQ